MAARKEPDVSKTWFITSAGRDFGKGFAKAALSRGDKVGAAARNRIPHDSQDISALTEGKQPASRTHS
jgi:NAD(P)-dependent dehydrogenase (short-subunit alcohol dehydrogenase family)